MAAESQQYILLCVLQIFFPFASTFSQLFLRRRGLVLKRNESFAGGVAYQPNPNSNLHTNWRLEIQVDTGRELGGPHGFRRQVATDGHTRGKERMCARENEREYDPGANE